MSVVKVCSLAFAAWMVSTGAFAADGEWTVRKSSGEVWTGTTGAQLVSLGQSNGQETVLKPGDTVTTGRNGRVLLVRGQETILIAPNSIVGVPADKKDGVATTITQQAGSILLEVEKRNVPHFEVETPYLAAVVKGTQFRVSVTATGTRVDVQRGQVEVVDFKSGQIAQVLPGQAAQSFAHGAQGLSLTGSGAFRPIEHGAPRVPTLEQIKVPKSGITTPQMLERGRSTQAVTQRGAQPDARTARAAHHGAVRISAPLGEVRLNVHKVTHGLARSAGTANDSGRRAHAKETTIWNAQDGKSATGASAIAAGDSNGNAASASGAGASVAGSASGAASVSGVSAATAAVAAGSSGNGNSTGNGGGNSGGNGKGNGSGNGNGNGGGNGNGNSGGNGNGNGNAGNGNGNGNGRGKS